MSNVWNAHDPEMDLGSHALRTSSRAFKVYTQCSRKGIFAIFHGNASNISLLLNFSNQYGINSEKLSLKGFETIHHFPCAYSWIYYYGKYINVHLKI
ncbi:hypothetical protein CVS40_10289 [Lucilia cuprina]|nr:hypothetical protein CVS40_10289 [Lucilia cuprina]